ncbi:MAG: hypothetical protein Q8P13_02210 [bacterium]|nr:hypothetical protein [bacterium]
MPSTWSILLKKYFYKAKVDPATKQPISKPDTLKIGLAASLLFFILILVVILIWSLLSLLLKPPPDTLPDTNPEQNIELEKQRQKEASEAAQREKTPQAQLNKAYNEIVGAPDFLKEITLIDGTATFRYTINETDKLTILKTGYQNFADFAGRVFNIKEVEKLTLILYATGIIDSQGQSTTPAMTLEISSSRAEKVNWEQNKFRYETYPKNLDVNKINSILKFEYQSLIKKEQ